MDQQNVLGSLILNRFECLLEINIDSVTLVEAEIGVAQGRKLLGSGHC